MLSDSTDSFLWIALAAALVLISALQTAYYIAVSSLSESDLEPDEDGNLKIEEPSLSRVRKAKNNQDALLRSVWFWQIFTVAAGSIALSRVWSLNPFLVAVAFTAIVFLAGASLPTIGAKTSDIKCARRLSGICRILTAISVPFTFVLHSLSVLMAKAVGVDPRQLEDEVTEDEILSMVNEGHEQGSIDKDEAEMINNIFELDDKQAQDIMTHRGDIDAFEASVTLDEAISYMVDAQNSRFPVYEGSIDNIIGVLYLKDAMRFHMKEQFNSDSISKIPHLLREVDFIPETLDVDVLFRQMQESRHQMVIVINEYGETSGLVTMEDILEEIVGNILDEYDKEEKLIARVGERHLRMNGKALLDDVEKALHVEINEEDYDTLSGYLTERLGHIPTNDDRGHVIDDKKLGYRFRILSINQTMIGWLDVSPIPGETSETSVP